MSEPAPPPAEDLVEVTPDQLVEAIHALGAATFSREHAPAVRFAVAAMKTMLDFYALLSQLRVSVSALRKRLGVEPPGKAGTKKAGDDPAPPPAGGAGGAAEGADPNGTADDEESAPSEDRKTDGAAEEPDSRGAAGDGKTEPSGGGKAPKPPQDGKPPRLRKDGQPYGHDAHGRAGKTDFPDAEQRYFAHPDFNGPGCECPACTKLRVFLMGAVGGGLRFIGQPHLAAIGVNREVWRCGNCSAQFLAPVPQSLSGDGDSRVTHSAAATIACSKYLFGTPWARQESQSLLLDLRLPATTQWEHTRGLVAAALPVYLHLFPVAATAYLFFSDDTTARIIGVREAEKIQRTTGKTTNRTGVHTSCVVSALPNGRYVVIYKTAIIHAGELMDEVLVHRPKGLLVPYHMCDGHSANPPTVCAVIEGECNAHARRLLELKKEQFPAAWKYVESVYKTVYGNEAKATELGMTPEQRRDLHQKESLPLMRAMFQWMNDCFKNKTVEPNSVLGGIFEYFLKREYGLTMFCRRAGFPLDNNLCEAAQKLVAQHRKNAEYFRSVNGAQAADVIMSLGATAKRSGVNAHHYFVMLQRYRAEVKARPGDFLPWNYRETVEKLEKASPPTRVLEVSKAEFDARQQRLRSTKAWGSARKARATAAPPAAATG